MQRAGSASWRLDTSDGHLAQQALFVRDAARLAVPDTDGAVPPLTGDVPDRGEALDQDQHRLAAEQWLTWWRQILSLEFRSQSFGEDGNAGEHARRVIGEYEAVCDPPEFTALADRPALRHAVTATFEDFRRWNSAQRPRADDGVRGGPLEWSLIKQTAEDVAFDRGVGLDAVHATVMILPVQGLWWRRVAPGAVLCSPPAAADTPTARALLRDAFESQLLGL